MFKKYKVICLKSHMFKMYEVMCKKYKVICLKSIKSYV